MSLHIEGFSESHSVALKRRIIVGLCGQEGVGKSHFALTAPGAIAYFDFNKGLEGVVHKFYDQKDVLVYSPSFPKSDAVREGYDYNREWSLFLDKFIAAIEHPEIRTIVIDTGTEAWELLRLAKLGKLKEVPPMKYALVNAIFGDIIKTIMDSDKNFIMVNRTKDEYINNTRTGEQVMAGYADSPEKVQVFGFMDWVRDESSPDGYKRLKIQKCRHDISLVGQVLIGETCTFPFLGTMMFPDTSEEDWK